MDGQDVAVESYVAHVHNKRIVLQMDLEIIEEQVHDLPFALGTS